MGVYFGETEITNIDNLVPQTGQDITQVFFGSTEVFTVWGEYDGALPAQYSANGDYLADYRIYGSAGGVGDRTENLFNGYFEQGTTADGVPRQADNRVRSNIVAAVAGAFCVDLKNGENFDVAFDFWNDNGLVEATSWLTTKSYITPNNADGVRIKIRKSNDVPFTPAEIINFGMYLGSTAPTSYIPYGYEVDMSIKSGNLFDPSMEFNYTSLAINNEWRYTNGITKRIPCEPNQKYSIYLSDDTPITVWRLAVTASDNVPTYDAQSVAATTITQSMPAGKKQEFTTPSDAKYILFQSNGELNEQVNAALRVEKIATTPIYIGASPLEEDEYIDYESGKIYRKKQVHTDTVTIDGIVWDILGYDHDTVYKSDNTLAQHSVTIQAHNVLTDMQFDAREALFAFDSGLSAGTYHFTVGAQPWYSGDVGKTIQFTLAQAIPAGGQLVIDNAYSATMIGSTISSYASGTATAATETVTMSEGSDGTDLGTVSNGLSQDGVINSVQRALMGSNKWSESCIRQYLNSSASAGSAWEPKNKWDRPPTWVANTAGFLKGMSAEFIANLGTTSKTTALNNVTDGGGTEKTLDKVFLLARSEVYAGDETTGAENAAYPYYSNFSDLSEAGIGADSNRIKYRNGSAKYWWLRTSDIRYASNSRYIHPAGTLGNYYADESIGVAPACCIPLDDIETNDWLREKFLKPVDPPIPLPQLPTVDGTNIVDYAGQSAAVPSRFVAKYRKEGF